MAKHDKSFIEIAVKVFHPLHGERKLDALTIKQLLKDALKELDTEVDHASQ